jgi:NAD(P)-dependent dehydrogenase (short-subunit alcohol dehydrogenase family)
MIYVTDGPSENWKSIFDLNVLALSVCTKEAIESMKSRKVDDGHIVHINRYVANRSVTTGRAGLRCPVSFACQRCNRPWRSTRLRDVTAPAFCRQSAHSLPCLPRLLPGRFLVLISIRGWVKTRATARIRWIKNMQWPQRESNPRLSACSIISLSLFLSVFCAACQCFKTIFSVLNTCHFKSLKSLKPLHVSA